MERLLAVQDGRLTADGTRCYGTSRASADRERFIDFAPVPILGVAAIVILAVLSFRERRIGSAAADGDGGGRWWQQ
jgi:hypothetical protein